MLCVNKMRKGLYGDGVWNDGAQELALELVGRRLGVS